MERMGLLGHAGMGNMSCHLALLAHVLMPMSLCGFDLALGLELPEVACKLLKFCWSWVNVCSGHCSPGLGMWPPGRSPGAAEVAPSVALSAIYCCFRAEQSFKKHFAFLPPLQSTFLCAVPPWMYVVPRAFW